MFIQLRILLIYWLHNPAGTHLLDWSSSQHTAACSLPSFLLVQGFLRWMLFLTLNSPPNKLGTVAVYYLGSMVS